MMWQKGIEGYPYPLGVEMKTKTVDLRVSIEYPRRWRVGKVIGELEDLVEITEDTAIKITNIGRLTPLHETNR